MIDRRTWLARVLTYSTAAAVPAATAPAKGPAVRDSAAQALQRKVDEVASLADQLEIRDFDDVAMAARLAFDAADTRGGRGVTFRVPPRVMHLKAPLKIPDRIFLVGAGMRDTMFNAHLDGPMFIFSDVTHAGLSHARLGLGNRPATQGIRIEARRTSVRRLTFAELEIAGGGAAGASASTSQIGIALDGADDRIITECGFDRLIFSEVDRPVVERSTEGNEWTRLVIDQFGYRGGIGFDSVANANHYQGRIAGSPGPGATAFRQGGYRNMIFLRVDIGNDARALDLNPKGRNIVMMQRPAQAAPRWVQTPIGDARGNTLIDGDLGSAR